MTTGRINQIIMKPWKSLLFLTTEILNPTHSHNLILLSTNANREIQFTNRNQTLSNLCFATKDWKEPSQSFPFRFLYRFLKTRGWNSSSTRFSFIENPANQTPKHTQMTLKTLIQIYPVRKCLLQPNSQNTSKQNYPPHIVKRGGGLP